MEMHVDEAMPAQALGQRLAVGELADAGGEVAVGVVLAAREELADEGQHAR